MKRKYIYLVILGGILASCLSAFAEDEVKHVVVIPNAAKDKDLEKTGRNVASIPGVSTREIDGFIQIIDTNNGVVCYSTGPSISCVKK